ncbi:hypothetical protein [Chromobacterium violaceum]|uniref:hypothetical protein n=1 Tax=Chromobacterium violaceum TaxID=536 RepID=UPI001CE03E1D|nr:hypothetical protein [Chromobacterium violaceum]
MNDMVMAVEALARRVTNHRVFNHPMYRHWACAPLPAAQSAALFHQVQNFCASTRLGMAFPQGLKHMGLPRQAELMSEIEVSEAGHGPDLARMAGHIVNLAGREQVFDDLDDQAEVEAGLKRYSDQLLGDLPGYDRASGLTRQAREAIAVFQQRSRSDPESTLRNLGVAFALELISNRSLIPGEKRALVDAGHYGVSLDDPEMHYLLDHWGECGAEQQHELNVRLAIAGVLNAETEPSILAGVDAFLDTLAALWDVIDSQLLPTEAAAG